jgi:hypothetical protein
LTGLYCIIPGVIAAHRGHRTSRAANSNGTSRPRGLVREHGLTDSAAPGGRSNSGWLQQDADALCLANEHLNVRQLLAFQFAKYGEALGADPRDHRKFGTMRPLQIFDSEKARIRQSSGTGERQSSALPGLRCQPVLFKGRRFASNDVRQLCPQPLRSSRSILQLAAQPIGFPQSFSESLPVHRRLISQSTGAACDKVTRLPPTALAMQIYCITTQGSRHPRFCREGASLSHRPAGTLKMAQAIENWFFCDGRYRVHAIRPVGRRRGRIIEIEAVDTRERFHGPAHRLEKVMHTLCRSKDEAAVAPTGA